MAKKQKQGKISKDCSNTKNSSDISKPTVSVSNQSDLPSDIPSLFDVLFPVCSSAEDNSLFLNTDSFFALNSTIYAPEDMDQQGNSKLKNEPLLENPTSNESVTDVPVALGSSFPDNWFETSNKEFLSYSAASETQPYFQNALQMAPLQQMIPVSQSERFTEEHLGFTELMPPLSKSINSDLFPTTSQMALDIPHASTSAYTCVSTVQPKKRHSSESKSSNLFDDSDSDTSDDGSLSGDEELSVNLNQFAAKFLELRMQRRPCNFWQYNSQSRGPKGKRIYGEITLKDCHVLDEFTDPVAQGDGSSRHATKLRHGEGNDPRPDTKKMLDIGAGILRLEDEFRAITTSKTSSKEEANREKNKLASRICRLKKKAQHEANKVKLEGLREEHQQLVAVIAGIVAVIGRHFVINDGMKSASTSVSRKSSLSLQLDNLIQSHLKFMIAGHTSEYVNSQIEKAARCFSSSTQLT